MGGGICSPYKHIDFVEQFPLYINIIGYNNNDTSECYERDGGGGAIKIFRA